MTKLDFLKGFRQVQEEVHQNSKDKGFWEGPEQSNIPTKLMLIVSEIAEAMEAHRKPHPEFKINEIQYWSDDGSVYAGDFSKELHFKSKLKPEGLAIELADAVIRLMDLAEHMQIDLADAILEKMAYNKTRSFRHGGRAY